MSKHAKANWDVRFAAGARNIFVLSDKGTIAEVFYQSLNSLTQDEALAHANLIAAAPELLRELKSAVFYIKTYGGEVTANFAAGGNLDQIEALIKKAEGAK